MGLACVCVCVCVGACACVCVRACVGVCLVKQTATHNELGVNLPSGAARGSQMCGKEAKREMV